MLVNTSFNVREELNAPPEGVQALIDGRIDFLIARQAVYEHDRRRSGQCFAPSVAASHRPQSAPNISAVPPGIYFTFALAVFNLS